MGPELGLDSALDASGDVTFVDSIGNGLTLKDGRRGELRSGDGFFDAAQKLGEGGLGGG
jgi:hypothetical protein